MQENLVVIRVEPALLVVIIRVHFKKKIIVGR